MALRHRQGQDVKWQNPQGQPPYLIWFPYVVSLPDRDTAKSDFFKHNDLDFYL
jgi:hypothetical protein